MNKITDIKELYSECEKSYCKTPSLFSMSKISKFNTIAGYSEIEKAIVNGIYSNQDLLAQNYYDVRQYQLSLVYVCFENGVSLASLYNENHNLANESPVVEMMSKQNSFFPRKVLMDKYGLSDMENMQLCSNLFDRHTKLMRRCDPHSQNEAEEVIKTSLLAVLRLGETLIL